MSQFAVQLVYQGLQPHMFENMDGAAVFFESKPSSTVLHAGVDTISVRCCGSNTRRLTPFMSGCNDVTKLPLFFICIGKQNGHIEKYRYILTEWNL